MASAEFDETSEEKRPTVQVGDPFTEKLLLEACLEIMDGDAIVGIQDMGAAGLTSSSFEMAGRAGTGIRMHLDRVPVRESGMTPYEIMLSESQERMLIVAKRGREADVVRIFEKWDLNAAVIGEVSDDGLVRLFWEGEEVGTIPVDPISTEAPVYQRPMRAMERPPQPKRERVADQELTDDLLRTLASPDFCSKHWIWEQYDSTVRTNTIAGPEVRDAAIVRIKGTGRALAITSDVNPLYCFHDPYEGGKQAVAEAARFPAAGLEVGLIGETRDEQIPPRVDLDRERALVDTLLQLHENRLLLACHDLSSGGLAVALAECAMGGIGCHVELGGHADDIDAFALLFSESQARAIVACKPEHTSDVITRSGGTKIGRTVAGAFVIERNGVPLVRTSAEEMARVWRTAFALLLGGDTVDDVIRGVGEEAPEVVAH